MKHVQSLTANFLLVLSCIMIYFVSSVSSEEEISVMFAGDISFDGPPRYFTRHHYHTYNDTLAKVTQIIKQADIAVGNLESPLVPSKIRLSEKFPGPKIIFVSAEPNSAPALRFAGFDVMLLANNHMNDYGDKPVNLTVNILKKLGIQSFGINYGPYDAPQEPLIVEKKGIKLGFLGYCDVTFPNNTRFVAGCSGQRQYYRAGPAIYSNKIATRDINLLKQRDVDVIIVYFHWGKEYCRTPDERQIRMANHLHSLGVHVVIGAHQHVLLGHIYNKSGNTTLKQQVKGPKTTNIIRKRGNDFTAFGVGNFLFGQHGTIFRFFLADFPDPSPATIATYQKQATTIKTPAMKSRIYQLQISKGGVVKARYLPLEILFNTTNNCLQPTPEENAHWIDVCSPNDKACLL